MCLLNPSFVKTLLIIGIWSFDSIDDCMEVAGNGYQMDGTKTVVYPWLASFADINTCDKAPDIVVHFF
jgi:hypothetical protein